MPQQVVQLAQPGSKLIVISRISCSCNHSCSELLQSGQHMQTDKQAYGMQHKQSTCLQWTQITLLFKLHCIKLGFQGVHIQILHVAHVKNLSLQIWRQLASQVIHIPLFPLASAFVILVALVRRLLPFLGFILLLAVL